MTLPPTADQVALLQRWCLGEEGRAAARSDLRRLGLPADDHHVDDLCQAVVVRVWGRLERGPLEDGPDGSAVVAYARRSLRNASVDLLRRGAPARVEELVDPTTGYGLDHEPLDDAVDVLPFGRPVAADDDPDDPTGEPGLHDAIRHALHRHLGERRRRLPTWPVAAALVTLELAAHPDLELADGTPVPEPRSPAARAGARWAGLAYAGRTGCFEQPETGAVRERRAVALRRLDRVLRDAAEAVAADGGTGDPATGGAAP